MIDSSSEIAIEVSGSIICLRAQIVSQRDCLSYLSLFFSFLIVLPSRKRIVSADML